MADKDIATKAPESDAQEKSSSHTGIQNIIPSNTPAQEGEPSMGVRSLPSRVYVAVIDVHRITAQPIDLRVCHMSHLLKYN